MKKITLLLSVLTAFLLLPAGLHAQQTLTINHGTWRDRHAPFYSFNLGGYNLTEFVLPADSLTAMNDSLITSMSFQISWPSDTENANWEVSFRVYVKEVPYTTISAFEGDSTSTVVYYGRLSATNGVMKVTFNEPYHYQGGNLLIGFRNLTKKQGNGNYPDYWWAGATAPVNTVLWDVKLYDNETFTPVAVNPAILPLTTFEYQNKSSSTVIDFETNDFSQHTFTTINEPWVVVPADNGSGYCMKNSNSNSGGDRARTRAAYNYMVDGYIIFDAKCLGSTSSSFNYDVCTFYIDWGTQFKYGSQVEGWHTYMFPVSAGDHTFDWEYYRYSNSPNRGFFVDNIVFGIGTPCVTPHNFKVRSTSIDTVTLSWLGYSDNYTIRYRTIGGSAWTTLTGITGNNYNLGGIPQGDYEVQISADCEPDNWVAATFSIENLQSTANCYGYVGYNYSGTVGSYSFISFPIQQPSSITAATGAIHSSSYSMYTYTAAYANGYVWCIDRDGDLTIARLDNTHKTISDFETIVSGFESKSINTMSYNPADGLIYYITADSILKCFNPFQPNQITEIGTFNKEILAFAINSLGEAYGVEIESGDLYRINLNDASTILVGPTGVACKLSQGMAFDLQTNELFWAQYYSYSSNGLYKVNTNTGYATYLGTIGQIRAELMGMFVGDDNQPNCEIPLNFTVSNVSYYNATLSWDGNASATEWAIEYDTTASFTTPTAITSSTNQKELTGLTPKTLYYVRVKAICGANGVSPYVTRQFTTPPTCPAPDYVAGSDFQPRSFTVNWNPGHASEWTFEYDTTDNFTTATSVTVSVPYYQATGLTPATTYYIRIKADCGGGDESDWAVRHLTLPVACAAPTNLSVSNISDTSAVLSWNATAASEYVISLNGTELTPVTGTTYTLNGLTAGTSYEVKVRGNCGSDGYSEWSSTLTFMSAFCPSDDQCEIRYKLNDSYGDGWQGCGINVVDVATDVVISTLTLPSGSSITGSLPLCNGREIRFEWVDGSYPEETSYTIFTPLGDTIFSGSNVLSTPVSYTMNCPACTNPRDLTVTNIGSGEVELTWSGNSHANGWVVEYSTSADFTGATTINVSTNSATLSGLTPHIPYYVHVKADCGVDGESAWSETANFIPILSTDIWYAYASNTSSGQSWNGRFIRFSMQNPEVVENASALKNPATYAATYANGYVWFFIGDSGDLWRAPLNNHDIGPYETVVPELEDDIVGSMSYNPVDGKIYYLLWYSQELKCFDPAQPNHVTTIDTIDKFFRTFAINSSGEAFIIDNQGDLYRVSLTDASTTLVGSTGVPTNYAQSMAFDHNTGELFWAQFYYTNTSALYLVNPTTAAASLIGHIGGDPNVQATGLFMAPNTTSPTTVVNVGSCSYEASYVPSANLFTYSLSEQIYTAAEIGESGIINSISFFNNGNTVTRNYDIYLVHTNKAEFFGGDWVPVTTADLVFSGDVQMVSNAWSEITLDVPFDYNGIDNLMILMDDNTGTYLNNDLHCSGDVHYEDRSLYVCGYSENYNPLTLSNYSSYLEGSTCCLQFNMTLTCQKPHNLSIIYNNQHDATLTWECNATNFNVEYKKTTDATWQSLTTTNHSVTLNSLALGDYEFRVKAVCTPGVSESDWETTTFSIVDVQSTANWYTLITSSFDHPEWNSKYITFSMQDVTTGTTASAAMSYSAPIATYADGYVWTVDNDPNTHIQSLFRAPLDNNTQTIGAQQTVASGFENGYIDGISYNPVDGRIYYVLNNQTIKSFHPSSPGATTVVCTVSGIYIRTIAFNSQGSAYFIDDIYRRLYRLNMADASYTLVGDLPNAVFMDFDHTTDELFCSCYDNGYHIGLVDTATAAMHDLGYVGGDDYVIAIGLFMASSTNTNPDVVHIGTCTSGDEDLPSNSDYDYGLSQQIYTAAEIGRSGSISSVSFYNSGDTKIRNYDVYLVHTNKTSFSSGTDWVPVTSANLVFSGDVEMKANEWTSIDLDFPFSYNGTDNLLLVMDDNTDGWSSGMSCNAFITSNPQALYIIDDYQNFDPGTPNLYDGTTLSKKNCIQLNFGTICPKPKNLAVSANHNEVTLTWTGSATSFNVEYKKTSDTQWQQTSTTGNTITLNGLDYDSYQVRVKAVCDPSVSESDPVETSFTLFNLQSTANWYSFVSSSPVHPDWSYRYVSFSMQNITAADTASEPINNYISSNAYANGYVWCTYYNYNQGTIDLGRAPLDNVNKTIGILETVMMNFDTVDIFSMAYNPIDSKLYYVGADNKLKSFNPANPNSVTVIGTYTQDFHSISINSLGEAYCVAYDDSLYRMNLTNASVTLVGYLSNVNELAFDLETDELFGTAYSGSGIIICSVNPSTAAMLELEFIGGDPDIFISHLFMVSGSAQVCYAPTNLNVSSIGMHNATISWDANTNADGWVVEYATAPDFSNAMTVTVTTNSCHLTGLVGGTIYYVRVKADCGATGESYWTVRNFITTLCESIDQCEISYKLADSASDGWNECAINVVDVATDIIIGTLTMDDGDSLSGVLPVCDGRDIRFEWVSGYYANETSYTIFSALGDTLFSGSNALSAPVTYTVNCPANPNIVEIGSCNGGSDYLPSHSSSNYSFSQQIYTASEINRTGTISGISFYNAGTTQTRNYDMYLVHTNKSEFDHNLDWISTTPANLVFSGPIEMAAGAWTEIALDVPFAYNGTDNILLVMNDKTGNNATGMSCHTFHTTAIEAIYGYRDGSSYDPMFPHSILGDYNHEKNCVRLNFGTNCTKPANLTVSENGMNQAKVVWDNSNNANTWIVEYSTAADFSGAIATNVTTNSYLLTGLTPETEYHVRVKADCGADGESYWNVISFFTNSCPIENQCEITYKLGDSYGDGWTGNAINVVDVTSNIVLDTWTIEYGDSASGSLFVCDGREIKFEWVSGYDPNDISYRVYDANGVQILNGVGAFLTPVTYMVNCTSSPCPTPDNIAVSNFSGGTVTVSWTENGSATSWQICLDGDEANPISVNTNPYTLSGLDSTVFHNVKVRANCGSDYSFWSTPASFAQVQSTGNWYAYVQSCPNNTDLRNKFVSFSAQDPANASAASNVIPNVLAATYANGEVWFFDDDNTTLYKAPLDNNTKTMGAYETVATNFDGNNNIASMSYNPVDGRIYYILYTPSQTVKLKSFAPSSINDVTEIGTFNNYAFSIAIDNNSNAYCTDLMTGNLCQVNLTNATTTPVGDLGFSSTMPVIAFDMNTGELLMGQLESSGDNGIYLVNPATAEKQFVGYIGGGTGATISGLFMVSAAPVVTCPAPTNLTASNITHNGVDLSWTENGSATGWQVCINGNETSPIDVYTNPYTLSGLSSTTTYTVKVRANCGADGTSDWSNEVSFTTDIEPLPPYFYITGDDSICPNQTTNLTVNTNLGDTYLWSTSETSATITVPVGTYYVTVSNNGNEVAHGNFTVGAKETYNITLNDTICEAELPYLWNSITFNAAGDTTLTLTAANGCDSVVSLHLTVYSTDYTDLHESICEGESFVFNGKTISQDGVYVDTLINAHHCDSIVTLHLTVNPISTGDTTAIACDSFDWYEHTNITASCDNLTHAFTNANGCDSVVTLHLTINHSNTGDTTATAQDSFTWYEHTNITQTGNYTHTFINADGCDSVVTLHLTIGHSSLGDTTATACDSFDWYEHTGITQSGDYTHTFVNAAGYDSVVTLHLTVNYSNTGDTTARAQDSFSWYEYTNITQTGNYTHTFINADGCDSVVTLHLTIGHSSLGDTTATACDSFDWYEHTGITQSGDYTHTFVNAAGYDSLVTLHLTVNYSNTGDTTATACDSFDWYEHTNVTASCDNLTHTFTNASGCDSVVTLHLTVNYSNTGDTTATAQDSFTWYEHTNIMQTGNYTHTFVNATGCDSVVTLHLTIGHSSLGDTTATACDSFDWYEYTGITQSGDYTHTFVNAAGYDSLVTLHLTVNYSNTGDTTATAQDSFTWYEHTNIMQTGNYTHTFVNAAGCDSVVTLHLTIGHSSLGDTTATACDSFDWYEHTGITQSGDYTHTFVNAAGYDSVVTLHLTVNYSNTGDTTATACDSFDWYEYTGITQSGDYTHTFTNANGCDSVVTLHLTVYSTDYADLHVSICENELPYHYVNGQIDTTFDVGTPSLVTVPYTLSTVNGCDSIVTLHLTISPVYHVNESRSICPDELPYTWNNFTFGTGGTQTVTLTSSAGCDSIVTMTLILYPVYNVSETRSICRSELPYTWNNFTFGTGGTQTVTLTSSAGCDSVVTMTLVVNEPVSTDLQVAACDSYEWNGETYTESGVHTLTFTAANGCDSVVTLHLTINHAVSSEFTVETSDSCYTWNEQVYCVSGDYEQTLTAANGCDSVVTLHLTLHVGIDNYDFAASMTVYPNPTTGILNIQITNFNTPISEFLTYDVYGKLVDKVRTQHNTSAETTQIDLSHLSNGIYFVKAVADGKVVAVRKVVKQ